MNLFLKNKRIVFVVVALMIAAYGMYKYAYKPHETIESLTTSFVGDSSDFLIKIQENPDNWQNKVVQLTGKISSKDKKGVLLNNSIYCQFRTASEVAKLKSLEKITIKGRIIGYDDLLEELKLDQCIIQKQ